MPITATNVRSRNGTAAAMLALTVAVLALPSALLAFTSRADAPPVDGAEIAGNRFLPALVDPRLARSITVRALSKGRTFRFTPAATPTRTDSSLTVAVRLDQSGSRPIVVRGPAPASVAVQGLAIAPTGYSLGTARPGRTLAPPAPAASRRIEMPDLAAFRPSDGARQAPSRFSPRVELEDVAKPGRSPRTFEGQGSESVDLGGSYSVTRNLNVTAGVRYTSERDRLVPLANGTQNQAVYVGTRIRF